MYDPNEYTVTSRRTTVDGEAVYEARVVELPDVVGYGETREEAETAAIESISGLQDLAREMGHTFPAPNPVPAGYSGRVTLRVSRSLHRQVALLAHLEDVSLNQFINEAIAARVVERQARRAICTVASDYYNVKAGGVYNVTSGGILGISQSTASDQIVGGGAMTSLLGPYRGGSFDPRLTGSELFGTTGRAEEHVRGLESEDIKGSNWYLPLERFGDSR